MSSLKILYQLGAALGSHFNIDQLLEVVMDLVFETVKADRGFILVKDQEGELVPKVVRMRDFSGVTGLLNCPEDSLGVGRGVLAPLYRRATHVQGNGGRHRFVASGRGPGHARRDADGAGAVAG